MGADQTFDPTSFQDLREEDRGRLEATGALDEVGRLAADMLSHIDEVTDHVMRRVVEDVPGYAGGSVQRDDLWWSCKRNSMFVLRLLVEDRGPSAEELRVRRALGVRRAQQGMPVEDILQAYHAGCLVLWEHIVSLGQVQGSPTTDQLLARAGRIWSHMHAISAAVTKAHRMEVSRREAAAHRGPAAFIRDLRRWPHEKEALESAREVGLDPEAWFIAAVHVDTGLTAWPRPWACVNQPDRSVLVVTADPDLGTCERVLADMLREAGADHIGIGLTRQGLDGARQSLKDAEQAHALGVKMGRRAARFRQDWFQATALANHQELLAVVGPAVELLDEDGELRETLEAYIRAEGRLGRAATYLHVHPNTVSYRLERLSRKTGIDARSPDGQLDARLALTLTGA